jgi:DNA-binding response OmpR family regulator
MTRCGPPSIVICARDLPDGNWKQLLQDADVLARPPRFVVSSRLADEYLWVEVLNLGGHDVLTTPFDAREVSHVVRYAAESWHQQWEDAAQRRQVADGSFGLF